MCTSAIELNIDPGRIWHRWYLPCFGRNEDGFHIKFQSKWRTKAYSNVLCFKVPYNNLPICFLKMYNNNYSETLLQQFTQTQSCHLLEQS